MTAHPSPTAGGAPVLLLSGAGLPAWIWDDLRSELADVADTAVAPPPDGPSASLADYADIAAARAPWPRFAVVAHSVGGVVAAELLARHPGRVTGVLGLSAVVPRPGRSFVGSMPLPARLVLGTVLRVAGTRPPDGALRKGLAAGLPAATAERVVADVRPESVRLYLDRAHPRSLPAVRGYLRTTRDRELTVAAQQRFAAVLQATWTEELPTGHLPMLEDPVGVAAAVRRLVAAAASP